MRLIDDDLEIDDEYRLQVVVHVVNAALWVIDARAYHRTTGSPETYSVAQRIEHSIGSPCALRPSVQQRGGWRCKRNVDDLMGRIDAMLATARKVRK